MAHFLRGKQAGVQKDFSEGLSPDLFGLDDVRSSPPFPQPHLLMNDPVQSSLPATE